MGLSMVRIVLCVICALNDVTAQSVRHSPFFCDMSTLTRAERTRKEEIGSALAQRKLAVRELPNGYEFLFPGDRSTFQLVAEWTETERLCCPFFDFERWLK